MPKITTNTGRRVFKKAKSMLVVPYVYNSTLDDYILGSDIYDISAIIGDSIVLEQSEGNTATKENEFTNQPIIVSHSGSKYGFTAQCLDVQDSVLKALYGAMTAKNRSVTPAAVNGAVAVQNDYTEMYALIRVEFEDESMPYMILPRVQMSNKLLIQQLKTRAGQGNIAGQAFSICCAIKDKDNDNKVLDFGTAEYVPETPVLFVPKLYVPLFAYERKSDGVRACHQLDFENGGSPSTVYVNPSNGNWSNSYTPQ